MNVTNLKNYAIVASTTGVIVAKNIDTRKEARTQKKQIQNSLGLSERDLKIVQLEVSQFVR